MRIDAHQHYWHTARGDYDWMPKEGWLYRPYLPPDLAPHLADGRIDGTILIQAAATVNETEYMLGLADATPSVLGIVGWIDFENPADRAVLERLSEHPKFLGVRPMIQDIPDVDWMLRPDVQWAFEALVDLNLTFDALGFPTHLANFHTIFTRYPGLRVVVDHAMKPDIAHHTPEAFQFWADGMAKIAEQTGAYVKLSTLSTLAAEAWTVEDLRPYSDLLLAVFGPDRVMWGSDWPVSLYRATYEQWLTAAETLTDGLSEVDRAQVFGGTAQRFYIG